MGTDTACKIKRVTMVPTLSSLVLSVLALARAVREEKDLKGMQIKREEVKKNISFK